MNEKAISKPRNGAELLVQCLEEQGVQYIFGIPGAKVDTIFDVLADHGPRLILCRHEQNAAFMAGMVGLLTGTPGVCLVTSGPGVTNLTTGLSTATCDGYPLVALGGNVRRGMRHIKTHQSLDNVGVMQPVTKYAVEIYDGNSIPEVIVNAFRQSINTPVGGFIHQSSPGCPYRRRRCYPYQGRSARADRGMFDVQSCEKCCRDHQ